MYVAAGIRCWRFGRVQVVDDTFSNAFKPNVIECMCQNVIAWLGRDILGATMTLYDSRSLHFS
jgi:hypothetical protein